MNEDVHDSTPSLHSGRTSTANIGRSSLGGMFSRLRPSVDSPFPRHGSPVGPSANNSKPNSLSLARESVVIPEREPDETPAHYLGRLQEAVNRGVVAGVLSKFGDAFSQAVLKSYMRSFAFFEDPMDMAIRKLLMRVELPRETQQIDRLLEKFADRYHECNPGIFCSSGRSKPPRGGGCEDVEANVLIEQAYFIAFSLLILQTDAFNKNNKHKMQRHDYIKNTHEHGEGISEDILSCFYDNICYTPFIHVEEDLDTAAGRVPTQKTRKGKLARGTSDTARKPLKEPIDPYMLIIDNRLDFLRPNLKDVMDSHEPYRYLGTAESLDVRALQRAFFKWGILQIVSARSRPEAFLSPTTIINPEDTLPGVVDIKVTKIGILWRKEVKKKKTRSPWQEWGAILTGSQLYFFRNLAWIKNLLHQYDQHQKTNRTGTPVKFKPPIESLKPDALISTANAVGLLDFSYRKHKNAFIVVRHGGFEETLLADSESEMNDWLAKLNYAAAFRTAGVRMRTMVGRSAESHRIKTSESSVSASAAAADKVQQVEEYDDAQLSQQILVARRQIMRQKILEANETLQLAQKQLEHQLRNSRHLQILAPIQSKSREQVILAAGRMAAKLKWIRMEILRLRCHRDILLLDLRDEGFSLTDSESSVHALIESSSNYSPSERDITEMTRKDMSHESLAIVLRPLSFNSSLRPFPRKEGVSASEVKQSPSNSAEQSGSIAARLACDSQTDSVARPSSVGNDCGFGGVLPETVGPAGSSSSPAASHHGSAAQPQDIPTSSARIASRRMSSDEAEAEVMKQAGLGSLNPVYVEGRAIGGDLTRQTEESNEHLTAMMTSTTTATTTNNPLSDEEGNDKSKMRRSLHRSLREGHHMSPHHHHHRYKKGRDSTSSAAITEDGNSITGQEGLARGAGSFTLHGKKASVVTFGSEWQSIPPEDQIRQRKQIQSQVEDVATTKSSESGLDSRKDHGQNKMIRPLSPQPTMNTTTTLSSTTRGDEDQLPIWEQSRSRNGFNTGGGGGGGGGTSFGRPISGGPVSTSTVAAATTTSGVMATTTTTTTTTINNRLMTERPTSPSSSYGFDSDSSSGVSYGENSNHRRQQRLSPRLDLDLPSGRNINSDGGEGDGDEATVRYSTAVTTDEEYTSATEGDLRDLPNSRNQSTVQSRNRSLS